jgi:hypothetical protein
MNAHPRDEGLKRIWGGLIGEVIALAEVAGSPRQDCFLNLGDGRELVVHRYVGVAPKQKLRLRGWLARQGIKLIHNDLPTAIMRAIKYDVQIPDDLYSALQSEWSIRPRHTSDSMFAARGNLLAQMRTAVARYERADLQLECDPSNSQVLSEHRVAKQAIITLLANSETMESNGIVRMDDDGTTRCDLGDGRVMFFKIKLNGKLAKKHRSHAISWLGDRGKKRIECLADELWQALEDGDTSGNFLLERVARAEITICRKK